MVASNTTPRVGSLRPSQLIFTFGVGSVVDLPGFSAVVAGLDQWDDTFQQPLTEERLLAAVQAQKGDHIRRLLKAPWEAETRNPFDRWAFVGVPVLPFPRWLRCTGCNRLAPVESRLFTFKSNPYRPHLAHYEHVGCPRRTRPPHAVAARFAIACPAGHLDDFPWSEFCHHAAPCSGKPLLEVREVRGGSRSTDVSVRCATCDANAYVGWAFGPRRQGMLPKCRGRHPHLKLFEPEECPENTRALLLGASNQWFPVTISALSLPTAGSELAQLVDRLWAELEQVTTRDFYAYAVRTNPNLRPLAGKDEGEVWALIQRKRSPSDDISGDPLDVLAPEWALFANPASVEPNPDFRLLEAPVDASLRGNVERVVAAERLREVVALWGFTRIDGPDSGVAGDATIAKVAPLDRENRIEWVPATEVRGEGIFVQFPEERVVEWLTRAAGSQPMESLRQAHHRWRERRHLDLDQGWPGDRYVLLHSFAHALVNAVALECGYPAASIRERVYAREAEDGKPAMAGVLLYTSAPDSEGTLGGLVSLTGRETFARVVRFALDRADLCSSDPFCADHRPSGDSDVLHNAACHACLFLPETSCERGNRYLDRTFLVETLAAQGVGYFRP